MKKRPSTISYSIFPSKVTGWLMVILYENGEPVRGRHMNEGKQAAIKYIKEEWRYLLRTPAKYLNKLSSYQRMVRNS